MLKVGWNMNNSNVLAILAQKSNKVLLLDQRKPMQSFSVLEHKNGVINSFGWHPASQGNICTVGDDGLALIWELQNIDDMVNSSGYGGAPDS